MKWFVITLITFTNYFIAYPQGYNARWVLSNNNTDLYFADSLDSIGLDTILGNIPMFATDADICDTDGNLLFFTNGVVIADKNGSTLINGDSLSPCEYTFDYYNNGLGIDQATLFLPKPGSYRYYYLIHFSNDTSGYRPGTLYYSLIDVEGNNGLGAVIEKNVPFFKGAILREGGMTVCKHANGRDYWIVIGGHNDNTYYEFLLTPDSILGPYKQNFGPVYNSTYDWGYSKFSLDGSKYVTGCALGLVLLADFDRCSGLFSNPITLYHDGGTYNGQPVSGSASEEFSSNGRYLYVANVNDLTQYDLWADTIQDSIQIWNDSSSEFYQMELIQIAPNGKIYGSTHNGGLYALHVINFPNLKGDSCGFVFGGQPTLSLNSNTLPNMINYNLGPLLNSGCDTIKTGVANVSPGDLLRVMPNPADKYLYVEMGMQGNYEFDLLNENGQVIERKETRQVDNFDTENLASGVYFLKAIDKGTGKEIETKKIVVQH